MHCQVKFTHSSTVSQRRGTSLTERTTGEMLHHFSTTTYSSNTELDAAILPTASRRVMVFEFKEIFCAEN